MNLPTVFAEVTVNNPEWTPIRTEDGSIDMGQYYTNVFLEAEILTLNLNSRSMRIRFTWMNKIETRDIPMPKNMGVTVSYK